MRSHRILQIVCLLLFTVAPVYAQGSGTIAPELQAAIRTLLAKATPVAAADAGLNQLADAYGSRKQPFLQYVRSKPAHRAKVSDIAFTATFRDMLKAVENGRVDEQAGGSAGVGGAASAAEKAGIAGLITGALESGAMTQSLDQNVLTLRANGEGLFRFLSGQDVLPACSGVQDASCDPSKLNNLELSVSLNVSESNTISAKGTNPLTGDQLAGLFTSSRKQVSSASARYAIVNTRDLRSSSYRTEWEKWYQKNIGALQPVASDLLKAIDDLFNVVLTTQANEGGAPLVDANGFPVSVYAKWLDDTRRLLLNDFTAKRGEADITRDLSQSYDDLETQMRLLVPDFDARLELASNAYSRYFALTSQGLELGNKPMLTAELTYAEPTLQPKLITGKVSFAWSPKKKGTVNPGTVTLNGGVSRFASPQPSDAAGSTSVWRDAQFALQFDRTLGAKDTPTVFTLGTYIQYQMSAGVINVPAGTMAPGTSIPLPGNATQLLAPKGTIAVIHAGLTLQLPNSGVKVPIGISWSNRTELLTGNEIRGHIGFTFDTHSLMLAGK